MAQRHCPMPADATVKSVITCGQATRGRALGLALIFITALIWVAASFISQALVGADGGSPYNVSPFLLTYLSTSVFTLFLPLVQLRSVVDGIRQRMRATSYAPLRHSDDASVQPSTGGLPLSVDKGWNSGWDDDVIDDNGNGSGGPAAPGSLEADLDAAEAAAAAEGTHHGAAAQLGAAPGSALTQGQLHREALRAAAQVDDAPPVRGPDAAA